MKSRLPAVLILGAGLVAVVSAFAHPFGMVKARSSDRPLLAGTPVDPSVLEIFERSCQNCHSGKTNWPWYSYVAPMGWLIEKDVQQAREHMDLSRWDEYGSGRQIEVLTRMSAALRSRRMPLPRYLVLHPGAKLSEQEIAQIVEWTQTERRRLKPSQ